MLGAPTQISYSLPPQTPGCPIHRAVSPRDGWDSTNLPQHAVILSNWSEAEGVESLPSAGRMGTCISFLPPRWDTSNPNPNALYQGTSLLVPITRTCPWKNNAHGEAALNSTSQPASFGRPPKLKPVCVFPYLTRKEFGLEPEPMPHLKLLRSDCAERAPPVPAAARRPIKEKSSSLPQFRLRGSAKRVGRGPRGLAE